MKVVFLVIWAVLSVLVLLLSTLYLWSEPSASSAFVLACTLYYIYCFLRLILAAYQPWGQLAPSRAGGWLCLLLALIGFMATLLQSKVGNSGVYLLSLVSGITDVDAITLSLSQLSHKELALEVAARAILLAGLVNSLVKGLLALVIGGRRLGLRVMLPYLLSILLILPLIWPSN